MKIWHIEDDFEVCDYFTASELACKGTGVLQFHETFLEELAALRGKWGAPLIVNSCCRSPEHNAAIGGHWRSLHLTVNEGRPEATGTLAIDFSTRGMDGNELGDFHNLARELGWSTGLNVKQKFLHCDRRVDIGLERKDFFY